mmetsp:Transcript_9236/g.22177  ORF Transcript_9236/g.22177 Transcript_9236/m.22177 type:complete len:233 (+) Transcript_9236:84-782(+)
MEHGDGSSVGDSSPSNASCSLQPLRLPPRVATMALPIEPPRSPEDRMKRSCTTPWTWHPGTQRRSDFTRSLDGGSLTSCYISQTLPVLPDMRQALPLMPKKLADFVRVDDPRLTVIDVRELDYFYLGQIPRCLHISFQDFWDQLPTLVYKFARLYACVVFCSFDGTTRCVACANAFLRASSALFASKDKCKVRYLHGGINGWVAYCNREGFSDGLAQASVDEVVQCCGSSHP